jgi:hypothetical protein
MEAMYNLEILGMGMVEEDLAELGKDRVAFVDVVLIACRDFAALVHV